MLMQPCVECGDLSTKNRCEAHQLPSAPKDRGRHVAHANRARWANLSRRLRRMSPFCEMCGTKDDLTVDHIVRVTDRPEWTYEVDNLRVLCRTHNSRISMQSASPEVEKEIEEKIRVRRARKGGGTPQTDAPPRPRVKASSPSHIMDKEVSHGDQGWAEDSDHC